MLLQKPRLIYLHAPKTAGNSIQSLLLPLSSDEKVVLPFQDGEDCFEVSGRFTPTKHAKLADYCASIGAEISTYRVAISVRHPVHRAISAFFSPARWMREKENGQWFLQQPAWDADAFLRWLENLPPMVSFLSINGKIRRPDHVIRFEHLPQDFDAMARALELPCRATDLPRLNRSAAQAEPAIDQAVRRAVEARFAEDFEFFGYAR